MWVSSFAGYSGLGFEFRRTGVYEGLDFLNHLVTGGAARRLETPVLALRQIEAEPLRPLLRGRDPLWSVLGQRAVVVPYPAPFEGGDVIIRERFGLRGLRERLRCHSA